MSYEQLNVEYHFPCPIYVIDKPEFLDQISEVSEEALNKIRSEQKQDVKFHNLVVVPDLQSSTIK